MIKTCQKIKKSKTLMFASVFLPTFTIMLQTAFDNIAFLQGSMVDWKYYILSIVASGGSWILRHYTNTALEDK